PSGEALRLGREVRAATRHLARCLVTPFLATPAQLVVTAPLVDLGALLVSQSGRRFAAETNDALRLATAMRAAPGHVAYLVFDERIAAAAGAADPFFAHVVLPRAGRRGATVDNLAKQLELDADGLRATIESPEGDPLPRARPAKLEEPFHAIRVTGARWRTLGGLAVDATGRVLGAENAPIPGLYATGSAAGGLAAPLAGVETLATLALARLAALDVAAAVAAAEPE
ncbi:MAG TPA: FAD-binding protein, partial [Candidatus Binatia bacterium]|nr:FAD-binding protein [Candidatus Binatia bacterium]